MVRNIQFEIERRKYATVALVAFLMFGAAGSVRFVGFAGRAKADEPADAPLPEISPAQLAAKIREAMGRYDGKGLFRVVFTDTHNTNFNPNQPIMVSFRGRARYESDGTRWRAEYDSMSMRYGMTQLRPDRWSTGFDGTQAYDSRVSQNEFILGESSFVAKQWTPRALIGNKRRSWSERWKRPEPSPQSRSNNGRSTARGAMSSRASVPMASGEPRPSSLRGKDICRSRGNGLITARPIPPVSFKASTR